MRLSSTHRNPAEKASSPQRRKFWGNSSVRVCGEMQAVMNHSPWEPSSYHKPAGKMGVADYTRGNRYNPTSSSVEGGIFAPVETPYNPHAAEAAQRIKAHPTGGGYGKADFLDRLAAAEARDGEALQSWTPAGQRPSMKPTKEEAMQALTKRQTTLRAAEERVRENQQEAMQERVLKGVKKQYANTPQESAIEQHEANLERLEQQRRRQLQLKDRDERMQMQINQHQMLKQQEEAERLQRQRILQARQREAQLEQQQQLQRQQYLAEREQASQQYYNSEMWQSRHGGAPGNTQAARSASPRPQGRSASPMPQFGYSAVPRRASPRDSSPRRSANHHSSTLVLAPPGGRSTISLG